MAQQPSPAAQLATSFHVRASAGDPPAAVRVRNLSSSVLGPRDAWGRPGHAQPALVSAEVLFRSAFDAAAADDRLCAETVHYGSLSRTVLAGLEEAAAEDGSGGLRRVLERVWRRLTGGLGTDGRRPDGERGGDGPSFLNLHRVRALSVTVRLPKASLLGEGVSLTASSTFADGGRAEAFALALRVHGLRVPTLIGVNENERRCRQVVSATVEIDGFHGEADVYTELEEVVVKVMENSSYETLEALGTEMANTVLSWLNVTSGPGHQVRIKLEKPTAVPFAECPEVEVCLGTGAPSANTPGP